MSTPQIPITSLDQKWLNSWKEVAECRSPDQGRIEPLPSTGIIFKVTEHIRATDPNAYEPKVISIGPYHQNSPRLKPMDASKTIYFKRILKRNPEVELEHFLHLIDELTAKSLNSNSGEINMSSNMLLLDGCFIIELLLANIEKTNEMKIDDPILGNMLTLCLIEFDMLLLENQLPFIVLERLFNLVAASDEENPTSLLKITIGFFEGLITDLKPLKDISPTSFYHLLHLFHSCFIVGPMDQGGTAKTESMLMTPCASDLIKVGVEFTQKTDESFSWHILPGIIEISPARLNSNSNSFYRNLITFEQCFFPNVWSRVMDYVMFMSCLIDSKKDLTLLRQKRIIAYTLDNHEARPFFRNLCKATVMDYDNSYLSHLKDKSMDVWNIYDTKWNRVLAKVKRYYLSNPVSMIYLILSAVFVVVLTVLQTCYTVLGYYHNKK